MTDLADHVEVRDPAPGAPIRTVVESLAGDPRLVHVRTLPATPARHGATTEPLPAELAAMLPSGGLWCHQARAIDLARAGRSVAVATGTAFGKSGDKKSKKD